MQQMLLSIPEPCHEDWDKMTPTQQGRFCNACARQVVDFSMMSDAEVLRYFSTKKNEKVCGRAYPDQLERAIIMPKEPKKKLFWYWHYITMLFLFFGKANGAKAQIGKMAVYSPKKDSSKPVVSTIGIKKGHNGFHCFALSTTDTVTIDSVKPATIASGLASKVSGLKVNLVDNNPRTVRGETKVTLGGVHSINSKNKALLVVDNMQLPISYLSKLSPNDIESVNVLKGASVSALYGSAAPDGVIIVTTKNKKNRNVIQIKIDSTVKMITSKIADTINKTIIKVYPNPVMKGNLFYLSLNQQQAKDLLIQITDIRGAVLLQKNIAPVAKEHIEKIETNNTWGSGIYYIRLFDSNNKFIGTSSFVIQ